MCGTYLLIKTHEFEPLVPFLVKISFTSYVILVQTPVVPATTVDIMDQLALRSIDDFIPVPAGIITIISLFEVMEVMFIEIPSTGRSSRFAQASTAETQALSVRYKGQAGPARPSRG